MNSPFIPLGSGEVLPWETHSSLSVIHQLKLFNFPIPKGIILINPALTQDGLNSELLEELKEEIRQRELKTNLAVTAFGYDESGVAFSQTCDVDSLGAVFNQALEDIGEKNRIDFLILEQIQGIAHGRAFSQNGYCDDWLEFRLGHSEAAMPNTQMSMEKLSLGETKIQGDFRGRVQDLLRSIRRALGEDNWIVGWTDTGDAVFLTSIEKMSSPLWMQDRFIRIHKWETSPKEPTVLEGSLIAASSSKLFKYFHHWAPELWDERPFVLWQNNQIEFNASLISDFLRSFGLATGSLKLIYSDWASPIVPFNTIRFWRNLPRFFRFVHDLRLGPGVATRLAAKLSSFETSPDKPFSDLFQEWQSVFVASSHALYRLSTLRLVNSYPFENLPLASRLIQKSQSAEAILKISAEKALSKIHQAIQMKALGWYSRNLISHEEHIWNMTHDQVLDLETKLE